jgi:hypothetical protein
MRGIVALIAGVISLVTGALCFVVGGRALLILILRVVTCVAWGFAILFDNRPWKNKQAIGKVGLYWGTSAILGCSPLFS